MKDIGAFRETYNNDKLPSIMAAIRPNPPEHKAKILAYLKRGKETGRATTRFSDKIGGVEMIPAICYTDDVYEWRSDTIYYYEKYNIELPKDFIEHVLKRTKR